MNQPTHQSIIIIIIFSRYLIMDLLVERWKKSVGKSNEKKKSEQATEQNHSVDLNTAVNQQIQRVKNKKMKNQKQQVQNREETPSKRKEVKDLIIADFFEKMIKILNQTKNETKKDDKIRQLLGQLWEVAQDNKIITTQTTNFIHLEQPKQNQNDTPSKLKVKMYNELEIKYFQSEKERHHLKGHIETLKKKYENVQKELDHLSKIERLVDSTLKRQQNLNREIDHLKLQIQTLKDREVEQQRIFKKEVLMIHSLIQSMKIALPS